MKFFVFIILYLTSLTSIYAESTSPSKGIIATSNPHASKAAKDISAKYVSPEVYSGYTCDQIRKDLQRKLINK